MARREERFAILFRDADGEWAFMPDGPDTARSTPFKHLQNARARLDVLRERYPDKLFLGATIIVEGMWE